MQRYNRGLRGGWRLRVYLQHVETLVPENFYTQEFAGQQMKALMEDEKQRRLVSLVYRNSGIDTRHSVLDDFKPGARDPIFKAAPGGKFVEPGTGVRNERFAREAKRLAVEVARRALERCPEVSAAEITHVITVTCTGFFSPGPDYYIARELGLGSSTQRYALGFMGCYAALPALRMASQFCQADPAAVVLVVPVELCSLHLRFNDGLDSLLADALFADGAAAAVVSAKEPSAGRPHYLLESFHTALIPSGEKDMAWRIGDQGFEMTLSAYVPDIIGSNIRTLIQPALQACGLSVPDIIRWAVHPGGRAIVDKVQSELSLDPEMVHASREVLRRYGNMSSATTLFVLKELLDSDPAPGPVCAIAFGPGLTVETAILRLAV